MLPSEFGYTEAEVRAMPVLCTDHAIDRIKQRFGLQKQAVIRFAKQAVTDGEFYERLRETSIGATFTNHGKTFIFYITTSANYDTPVLLLITAHPSKRPNHVEYKEVMLKGVATPQYASQRKPLKKIAANELRKNNKHKKPYKGHHDE